MNVVKIGLTYTGSDEKHNNYMEWLKAGEDIEIIRLAADKDNSNRLEECDALVLSGGLDMHPRYYRGEEQYSNPPEKFNEDRDKFELLALNRAMERSVPVLGICRGLQLINVFFDGTLVQDLGEKKNSIHRGDTTKKTNYDNKHLVQIKEGTLLHDIVQLDSGVVNSAHHQSIKELGNNLMANSISDDGVIEGIEWKEKSKLPFMLAVQWHPERMKEFGLQQSPLSKNIRDRFINETKLNMQQK